MMCGNPRDSDLFLVHGMTSNQVTDEQATDRMSEWVERAREHSGELVVAFSALDGMGSISHWPVEIGVIADEIEDTPEERSRLFGGVKLTEGGRISSNGGEIKAFDNLDVKVGHRQVYQSFQTYLPYFRHTDVPVFQIAFGEAAVAQWFVDNQELPGAVPHHYFRMAKMLGFEPSHDPVIQESVDKRIITICQALTEQAIKQTNLKARIEAVYGSVGAGLRSVLGGQALEMAPESTGEANLRTYPARQEALRTTERMSRLKDELYLLGVDEDIFYASVAESLGLSLLPDAGECDSARATITQNVMLLNSLNKANITLEEQDAHDMIASEAFGRIIQEFNSLPKRCRMTSSDGIGCFECQTCDFKTRVE
jgi:hypothetical protein